MEERIYTAKEAAKYLGIAYAHTMGELIRISRVPTTKIPHNGSGKGIRESDLFRLRDWVQSLSRLFADPVSQNH